MFFLVKEYINLLFVTILFYRRFSIFLQRFCFIISTPVWIIVLKQLHQSFGKELKMNLHDFVISVYDHTTQLCLKNVFLIIMFKLCLLIHFIAISIQNNVTLRLIFVLICNWKYLLWITLILQDNVINDLKHYAEL